MFVEGLVGLEAVVELAEELVEQVSLGLVVSVSGCAASVEVPTLIKLVRTAAADFVEGFGEVVG